jgi:hypothetical protein
VGLAGRDFMWRTKLRLSVLLPSMNNVRSALFVRDGLVVMTVETTHETIAHSNGPNAAVAGLT